MLLSTTSSPRTSIRGPERQAPCVRLALDTRLRGYDEVTFFLKINRNGRRGSAKVAEQVVLYGVPLLNIGPILILRSGNAASRRRTCKGGAYRQITLRDATLLRVRMLLSTTSSPRT